MSPDPAPVQDPGPRGPDVAHVVVAITGASGAVYGRRILEVFASDRRFETHLVVSAAGLATARHELGAAPQDLYDLADHVHRPSEIGATIASGSFPTLGMIVAPCSIKTLSAIANCYSNDLISRAADVTLKERRPLVLMVRETPLHLGHLRLMTAASEMGAIIAPPLPAFYRRPPDLDSLVDDSVRRTIGLLGVAEFAPAAWPGLRQATAADE